MKLRKNDESSQARYRHSVVSAIGDGTGRSPVPRGSIVASHLSIRREVADPELDSLLAEAGDGGALARVLREMMDVTVFVSHPAYALFTAAHFFAFVALYIPYVYLPGVMMSRGLSAHQARLSYTRRMYQIF